MDWTNKRVLITGGTGSIGRVITEILHKEYHPKQIVILSHSEKSQIQMENYFKRKNMCVKNSRGEDIVYCIKQGDISDPQAVQIAMQGCHIVIHLAAMKHIGICENNPAETIRVNIEGSKNVYQAAMIHKPEVVMGMSTDKAYSVPWNIYGYTKAIMEQLFSHGSRQSGGKTQFFCVRSGNVLDSSGSVTRIWRKQVVDSKPITITDPNMTRFWISLPGIARYIIKEIEPLHKIEIVMNVHIPEMGASTIQRLADIFSSDQEIVGAKANERFHETLAKGISSETTRTLMQSELIAMLKENEPYL